MMDWRDVPSLSALRAFHAYSATGSVVEAGARLNVSHAAISQHVRALEQELGVRLIDRSGRAGTLTGDGARLSEALQLGFGMIVRTVQSLTRSEADRPLVVTTTSAFASRWLLPRLAQFRAEYPGNDLVIDPTPDVRALEPGGADVALRHGSGNWPGLLADPVLRSALCVVGARTAGTADRQITLDDLAEMAWFQEIGTSEASGFLSRHGLTRRGGFGLTSLPESMVLDAVRDGQGVAVVTRAFVEGDIASGRLRVLFEDDGDDGDEGYYIVVPRGPLRPAVRQFRDWVLKQAEAAPDIFRRSAAV
jgi:LysR family glycine cleavage system transcriptional activator